MNRLRAAFLASVAVFGPPSLALAQSGQPLPDIDVTTDVPTAAPRVVAPAPVTAPAAAPVVETPAAVAPFNFTQDVTPANNTRVDAQEIQRTGSPDAAAVLKRVAPSVDIQGTSGNELTPDVVYRGFVSSPIQGTPQGLAVYQNGVRINEAFGDTMNWDMIPTFAIASMDVISSNPVYGLNALGGAINIKMKDGFTSPGRPARIVRRLLWPVPGRAGRWQAGRRFRLLWRARRRAGQWLPRVGRLGHQALLWRPRLSRQWQRIPHHRQRRRQ